MLKVLIVDDELIVRIGLKACIKWEDIGYEVVGMAENGINTINANVTQDGLIKSNSSITYIFIIITAAIAFAAFAVFILRKNRC